MAGYAGGNAGSGSAANTSQGGGLPLPTSPTQASDFMDSDSGTWSVSYYGGADQKAPTVKDQPLPRAVTDYQKPTGTNPG